ncbi:hypothetical protein BSKO_08844 [Bryopsis sp. KO-2023]|nr:hypothetical protein BSKO_08844 [Bryopsis sp. KO-2023]
MLSFAANRGVGFSIWAPCRVSKNYRNSRVCALEKAVWVQTQNKAVLTAAIESGFDTILFDDDGGRDLSKSWKQMANFKSLFSKGGQIKDEHGDQVGCIKTIDDGKDLKAAQEDSGDLSGVLVMDASDWQIIPAENLVASFQDSKCDLFAVATHSSDAKVMFEALETGTDGVVLKTQDPLEVRKLGTYLSENAKQGADLVEYQVGSITNVETLGMGDRVCVDLCEMLAPGEGMLVGSFSRGLFLIHSECAESQYISSRPFRVNAGPCHAYIQGVDGRTAYLSELKSGSVVLVADGKGRSRKALVGRVKQEVRPMVLVEAELPDGDKVSTILQNAETVRLVGPSGNDPTGAREWNVISVAEIKEGDLVYVLNQGGARHTGISIKECIVEK